MTNTTHTAKHTPGPWEVTGPHSREVITTNPSTYKPCMTIAKVGGYWDGEAQANATLIAAAPEMLDVLRQVESAWRHFKRSNLVAELPGIYGTIKSAIAKAEGK